MCFLVYSIQANNILRYFLAMCYVCCLLLFCIFYVSFGGASLTTDMSFYAGIFRSSFVRLVSLTCIWLIGLLIGAFAAYIDSTFSSSLMLSTVLQSMSIVGLFTCVFLPFLISSYVCFLGKYSILLGICFVKAIAFSYSGVSISKIFRSASWVIIALYMFSELSSLILLFYTWITHYVFSLEFKKHFFVLYLFLLLLISVADYCLVAPLLQRLF